MNGKSQLYLTRFLNLLNKTTNMIKTLLLSLVIICSAAVCNAQTTYPVALDFRSIGTGVPSDEAVKLYVDSFKIKHAIKGCNAHVQLGNFDLSVCDIPDNKFSFSTKMA